MYNNTIQNRSQLYNNKFIPFNNNLMTLFENIAFDPWTTGGKHVVGKVQPRAPLAFVWYRCILYPNSVVVGLFINPWSSDISWRSHLHDKCLNWNSIIILQDYKDAYLRACRKMMMMKTLIPASHPRQDTGNTNQLTRQLNIVNGGIINEVICGR